MVRLAQGANRAERSDAVANRQRILEAAREVFARRGLDAEVREIAERAGVGVGTLYRHFGSREGLLAALIRQAAEELLRRLQAVAEAEEPESAVRTVIQVGAEACERFGALTEAILAGRLDEILHWEDEFTGLLADLLRRGMQSGIFRSDLDIPVAAAALESIFTSGMLPALAAQRSYPGAADAIADFFLQALAKGPSPRERASPEYPR